MPEDDAATACWGKEWETPTREQFDELIEECTCWWVYNYFNTGVCGLLVLDKRTPVLYDEEYFWDYNGDDVHLFLPAAGDIDYDRLSNPNHCGFYWTNSILDTNPKMAYNLDFDPNDTLHTVTRGRCFGRSVRPVFVSKRK